MSEVVSDILVGLGTVIAVLASLAALRARSVFRRLHYLTVLTSVAVPLVGVGVIVTVGLGLTGAGVVAIVVLVGITGPVLGAATGRLNAQKAGVIEAESPR